jgi:hypothetical protein
MKGPTPCLIGTTLGSCSFVQPGSRGPLRECDRCDVQLPRDRKCVQVSVPGTMGHKSFCPSCFTRILDATQTKLDRLRADVAGLQAA